MRIGLALAPICTRLRRSRLSRKARHREIEAVPEHMHRRRLSDETPAKFFEDVIDRDEDLVKSFDVSFVIRLVLGVFGERRRIRPFVRDRTDLRLYAELCEIRKQ